MTCTIIVSDSLTRALRHAFSIQGRNTGRVQVIQRGVNMPAVKSRYTKIVFVLLGDDGFVKCLVAGMLELRRGETLVVVDQSVANDLDLRHPRDGLEVGVQDRFLVRLGLLVPVSVAF